MNSSHSSRISELLIASVTPQNLERGALWFSENFLSIKKARGSNPWWRDNSLVIEKDLAIKPSEFIRRLIDLGYERAQLIRGKGLFAVRGGLIEIWPVNTEKPFLIEFIGNVVSEIRERPESEEKVKLRLPARTLEKLQPGSYVVHVDHGVGIFRGITTENVITLHATPSTFFLIEYAPPLPGREPDRLYVPVNQKGRLTPYVGFETPKIHRLGGTIWQTTKRKIREEAEKLARELLELYAKRHTAERAPHTGDEILEESLHESFAYEETGDQLRAEGEILHDLSRPQPMDRILCGDVGFGKTEIAIRAALRVIASGKQVAVLTPTTVLAAQHEKTFQERFQNLPVRVGMLSRLTTPKDERQTLKDLTEGKVDCVIGTHRLLSRDVVFKDLGLVVIDEEQRFGVKQKEKFKEMRAEVDILSLSATPIPRTLSLALAKLRDISLIETPPPERVPIVTSVLPYSQKIIRAAVEYETKRGGQVYFLHNRIETLDHVKEKLARAILSFPYDRKKMIVGKDLQIGIIHGRMKEKEIIKVMEAFRNREIDVLLATTIIENGLDISSANTLIVDGATRLGLAEAHQLRGRIGRGATQAFAYFLYKPQKLTEKAAERLEALQEYSELGAGYQIALRDLEIRGAGNVLGKEQSGAINKVGLNLYCQMLADAVENVKPRTF